MLESVDFPAPFSPSSACTSPWDASKSTSSFATTPGNRFVIPRSVTADGMVDAGRGTGPARQVEPLALRASDDALHEPVNRIELFDGHRLTRGHKKLAVLVVDRA